MGGSKSKGHLTLPYIQGVTESLSRKFRRQGITTHAVPHETVRSKLRTPKDKDPVSDLSGVVYQLNCSDCNAKYIGETARPLRKRLAEHKGTSSPSPVAHHLNSTGHKLSQEKVLARDSRWFQRGVREAIYIRSNSPSLNQDEGRHHLPRTYDPLLLSRDCRRAITPNNVTTTNTRRINTVTLPSFSEQELRR